MTPPAPASVASVKSAPSGRASAAVGETRGAPEGARERRQGRKTGASAGLRGLEQEKLGPPRGGAEPSVRFADGTERDCAGARAWSCAIGSARMVDLPERDYSAFIFDCDGTLVDSMPLHQEAWISALTAHGAGIRVHLGPLHAPRRDDHRAHGRGAERRVRREARPLARGATSAGRVRAPDRSHPADRRSRRVRALARRRADGRRVRRRSPGRWSVRSRRSA